MTIEANSGRCKAPQRRLQRGDQRSRVSSSPSPTTSCRVFTRKPCTATTQSPPSQITHARWRYEVIGDQRRRPRIWAVAAMTTTPTPRLSPPLATRCPHVRESQPAPAYFHPRPRTIYSRRSASKGTILTCHIGNEPRVRSRPPPLS